MSALITAFAIAGVVVATAAGASGHTMVGFAVGLLACAPWAVFQLVGPARFELADTRRQELEALLREQLPELELESGQGTLRVTAQAVGKGVIEGVLCHVVLERQDSWARRAVEIQLRSPYAGRFRLLKSGQELSPAGCAAHDSDVAWLLREVPALGETLRLAQDGSGLAEGQLILRRAGAELERADVLAAIALAASIDALLERPIKGLETRGLREVQSLGTQVLEGAGWRVALGDRMRIQRRLEDLRIRPGGGGQTGNPVVDLLLDVRGPGARGLGAEEHTERLLSTFHERGDTRVDEGWLSRDGPLRRCAIEGQVAELDELARWLEEHCQGSGRPGKPTSNS